MMLVLGYPLRDAGDWLRQALGPFCTGLWIEPVPLPVTLKGNGRTHWARDAYARWNCLTCCFHSRGGAHIGESILFQHGS